MGATPIHCWLISHDAFQLIKLDHPFRMFASHLLIDVQRERLGKTSCSQISGYLLKATNITNPIGFQQPLCKLIGFTKLARDFTLRKPGQFLNGLGSLGQRASLRTERSDATNVAPGITTNKKLPVTNVTKTYLLILMLVALGQRQISSAGNRSASSGAATAKAMVGPRRRSALVGHGV